MAAFVTIRNGPFRDVARPDVRRWAKRMLDCLDLAKVELSIVLTDDSEIRELNGVFRQRDKATDVLAFAMREGEPLGGSTAASKGTSGEILGDVVISVETARRQAKEHRRTLTAEIQMLLGHGLLHLIGYDHRTKREETVMNAETERLCRAARGEPVVAARSKVPAGKTARAGAKKSAVKRTKRRAVTTGTACRSRA